MIGDVNSAGQVDQPLLHFIAEDRTHAFDRLRPRRSKIGKFTTIHVLRDAGMIVNMEVEAGQSGLILPIG